VRWPETISLIVCSPARPAGGRTFWSFEQAANRERFAAVQNESFPQQAEAAWPSAFCGLYRGLQAFFSGTKCISRDWAQIICLGSFWHTQL